MCLCSDMSGRYINPYTDFGFKYLFGTESNKENTLELVNALLQGREHIRSLTLIPTEQLGDTQDDRRSVFDVYCENEQGDKIIIEMQKACTTLLSPSVRREKSDGAARAVKLAWMAESRQS